MKIFFAADHAGFNLKNALMEHVRTLGFDVEDMGAFEHTLDDDYPDFVTPLAEKVAGEQEAMGIICAGSGQGEAMCANRVQGVRAAVFYGPRPMTDTLEIQGGHSEAGYDSVILARKHNNANVLSIGARFVAAGEADEAVRIFLHTPFSNDERHARRLAKY